MFGVGTQEILVILALAVIIVGPKKLPELASALGRGLADFRRTFDDLKDSATVDFKTEIEKENLLKKHPHLAAEDKKKAKENQPEPEKTKEKEEKSLSAEPEEEKKEDKSGNKLKSPGDTEHKAENDTPKEPPPAYDPEEIEF